MQQLLPFIQKEFKHIFRDKRTLLILFALPIALLIIFGFAISTEIRDAKIAVLDKSKDELSRQFIHKLSSSGYYVVFEDLRSDADIEPTFKKGKVKQVIVFPENFSSDFYSGRNPSVQIISDATETNTSVMLLNYTQSILNNFQNELNAAAGTPMVFDVATKMMYNPELKSVFMFVPGVMAIILMLVSAMMTSVTIAREKELGTMRVLTVSPLKASTIIVGKTVPYMVLAIVNTLTIILLGVFVFKMPINGSYFLLALSCLLFILTAISIGVMVSTVVRTQQVAVITSMLGLMLPTMLLSGFAFPIESIPTVLQIVSNIIPARWFIVLIKGIMIKGVGIADVWVPLLILLGMTTFFITLSIRKLNKAIS